MISFLVVLSVAISAPVPERGPVVESVLHAAPQARGDDAPREPLFVPDDAGRTYEQLLSKTTAERRRIFRQMPSSLKSSVWAHHLLTMVVRHPELTSEQRAIIQDALALFTPEWFEIEPDSPQWDARVDQPLRRLQQRAMAAFDKPVARELFLQLGPDPLKGGGRDPSLPLGALSTLHSLRPTPHTDPAPECECSVSSDWCGNWGDMHCVNFWCVFASSGCGTFFRYACEGMCRPT